MRNYIIGLFLMLFANSWAITPYKTYSVSDGLSNSTIKAICQDSLGYTWFGTRNGLIRFDGYEFRTYNYDIKRENTVYSNDITCLTKDKRGLIWVGTFNWIILFDPSYEKFVELNLTYPSGKPPKGVVTNIWIDDNNRVWVASKTGLYLVEDKKVKAIESLKGAYINSMAAYDSNNLLVEVMGKGVAMFDIRSNKFEYLDESLVKNRPPIYKIFRDSKGKVWLGADSNNLFTYQEENKSIIPVKIKGFDEVMSDDEQIHDILEYNDSTIILGTDNGLIAINPNTHAYCKNITNTLQSDLLQHNRVMSLFKDNDGALWIGTFNKGIKYYNPNRYFFNYFDLKINPNTPARVVGSLSEENQTLWIGHEQGISSMNMQTGTLSHINLQSQLSNKNKRLELFFTYKESPKSLYVYLLNRGLFLFDLDKQQIVNRISTPPTSQVRSMTKDRTGSIWIAEEELSIYNPSTGETNSNLPSNINNITSFMLAQDLLLRHNGNMLVGTRTSGVWEYTYDEQGKKKYSAIEQLDFEQLKDKNINILFEDSRKNIWVGTYGSGLFRCNVETRECVIYDTNNGLVHNSICGILEDEKNGDIWVAALNGLSKISLRDGRIINYASKTGFPLEEISRKAFFKGSNDLFYVGGSNGLVSFDPNSFKNGSTIPPIVRVSLIESLNINKSDSRQLRFDNSLDLQKVEFPHNHSSIIIKFSALNYFYPEGNKYAYKLEGLESDWKYIERNEVTYTNLPEGEYKFHVKVSNNDGSWSEHVTEVKLVVHPPIWRTIWAKIIYGLLALGILYFIALFFYNRKSQKYKQQINRIEKENIEKYYQMKLELFTKFSHELRTPLTLITGPTEDMLKDESLPSKLLYPIRLVHKNANRLLLLVNQLMDFRKLEHGSMILRVQQVDIEPFLSEQIESFLELAKKSDINLSFLNQYWEKNAWFDTELMAKVIFNLISNAIKFTGKDGEIIITSKKKEDNLIISVRDNGEGISQEDLEKIFDPFFQVHQGNRLGVSGSGIGLNLAKYIVNLHNGKIWAESSLGIGAEFFIELPLGADHFDEAHTEFVASADTEIHNNSLEKNSIIPIEVEEDGHENAVDNGTWILVIEDDEDLRHYIVSQLSPEYSILEAADGKEALSITIERIPDLIISDIQMPVIDGIELCNLIKQDARTAHIPIILLTARTMNEHIQEGYEAMADDYILKPFDSKLLKVRIKNLIANRIQLRKLFNSKFSSPDIPAIELTANDSFMKQLFEIVESRIDDSSLSINDLSSELGVSRAQFFRKIKAISDMSPNKIILNIRMKMAADFLKSKQYTVTEVAYKVGFSDPAYFSKTFKTMFNITPSDFIKAE